MWYTIFKTQKQTFQKDYKLIWKIVEMFSCFGVMPKLECINVASEKCEDTQTGDDPVKKL